MTKRREHKCYCLHEGGHEKSFKNVFLLTYNYQRMSEAKADPQRIDLYELHLLEGRHYHYSYVFKVM